MNKLFIFNINYNVVGRNKRWFYREPKLVVANRYIENFYIICDETKLKEQKEEIIKDKKIQLQQIIEKDKQISLLDYNDALFSQKTFNEILYLDILECSVREATIREAIEKLSPTQFVEIYGNTINIGDLYGKNK